MHYDEATTPPEVQRQIDTVNGQYVCICEHSCPEGTP